MHEVAVKRDHAGMFFQLTKRHLLVFFKNKIRVFYTLMVPVIIFIVYIFFLRSLELSTVVSVLESADIFSDMRTDELNLLINTLVDSWMLSGITALSTFTVSIQTNTIIVCDKENGVNRDFIASPVSSSVLIASYFLFNFVVTFLICFVFILICFIYLACLGEFMLTFVAFLEILGVLALTTIVATLFTTFISSFIKHEATLTGLVAIFSTAVGFLMGAYLPFSQLPKWVQDVCMFIPGPYSCAIFRHAFMYVPMDSLYSYALGAFENADELMSSMMNSFGYNLEFFNVEVGTGWQAFAIVAYSAILAVLNVFSGRKLVTVLGAMGKKGKDRRKARRARRALARGGVVSTDASSSAAVAATVSAKSAETAGTISAEPFKAGGIPDVSTAGVKPEAEGSGPGLCEEPEGPGDAQQ
ncbi:MAG: ABC transporter permease [Clostridia bacterium]|nr:ABC transporter permease [Clostridia bacterium]